MRSCTDHVGVQFTQCRPPGFARDLGGHRSRVAGTLRIVQHVSDVRTSLDGIARYPTVHEPCEYQQAPRVMPPGNTSTRTSHSTQIMNKFSLGARRASRINARENPAAKFDQLQPKVGTFGPTSGKCWLDQADSGPIWAQIRQLSPEFGRIWRPARGHSSNSEQYLCLVPASFRLPIRWREIRRASFEHCFATPAAPREHLSSICATLLRGSRSKGKACASRRHNPRGSRRCRRGGCWLGRNSDEIGQDMAVRGPYLAKELDSGRGRATLAPGPHPVRSWPNWANCGWCGSVSCRNPWLCVSSKR